MAAELAEAFVTIRTRMPGVGKDIARALGGADVDKPARNIGSRFTGALAGAVGGAVAAITSKAISMIGQSIAGAVERVDTMNNFPKIMANLGYSADEAERSIQRMSDGLKGLPTSLDGMAGMVQQLAPLTGGLDEATDLSLALNNALLAGGKPANQQANAMEQYVQQLSLGEVNLTSFRSLITAMPGQMDQLSQSLLGAGNSSMDLYEAMNDGRVTFDDFNAAILDLNANGIAEFASFEQQARDATDGIGTSWSNLQTAITRNLADIIQKLKPAIDAFISGGTQIANALGPVVIGVIDASLAVGQWASANRDWLIPLGMIVGALVAYQRSIVAIRAVKAAYAAASYGAAAATYASGIAAKAGAVAYAIQNSSLVKLIASLRANEALSLRTKIAIVASTVATNAAAVAQRALNLVLSANPIGLIITAILTLVGILTYWFTQTESGKKAWAAFTEFMKSAWQAVSSFFVSVWENYLKPVFQGIADVAVWVWNTILQPIFNAFAIGFAILGGILAGIWNSIIKPAFSALGAIVSWLWKTIVQPVFKAIGAIFKWIWNTIARPVIAAIQVGIKALGAVFAWLWANAIKPNIDRAGAIFKWLKEKVIDPIWNGIKSTISNVWNNGIKPVIDRLVKVVKDDPKKAFEAARDGITKAWDAIKDAAKKPVKFVINTVVNGLIGTINKIPGVNIPKVKLPAGFSDGGYTGALPRTAVAGVVHGDEYVLRSPARRRIEARHPGLLQHMNRTGEVPGFRRGGYVNPLPRGSYSISQPFHSRHNGIDMAAPTGTKIMAAQDGRVVHAGWWPYGGGNQVNMVHPDGVHTWYAHMSRIQTAVGAEMKRGQVIGRVGSTGRSTGPHLHYMVMPGGYPNYINPAPYLSGFATPSGDGWNPLSGLVDWVADKIKTKFPSAGMWVDAAAGVAKSMAEKAIEAFTPSWGTDDTGSTRATLFDNGGWLQPGRHLVENRTGRPEPILTGSQWSALLESKTGSDEAAVFELYDVDNVLLGTIDGRARRVTGTAMSRGSQRSIRNELGVS